MVSAKGDDVGGFSSEHIIDDTNPAIFDVEIADFDNDGDLDIGTTSYLSAQFSVFLNDRFTLSTDSIEAQQPISIYPNPTTDVLNFNGPFTKDLKVNVYDVLGNRIIAQTVKIGSSLDVSRLNNGIYIIKFEDFDSTYKFVKK